MNPKLIANMLKLDDNQKLLVELFLEIFPNIFDDLTHMEAQEPNKEGREFILYISENSAFLESLGGYFSTIHTEIFELAEIHLAIVKAKTGRSQKAQDEHTDKVWGARHDVFRAQFKAVYDMAEIFAGRYSSGNAEEMAEIDGAIFEF